MDALALRCTRCLAESSSCVLRYRPAGGALQRNVPVFSVAPSLKAFLFTQSLRLQERLLSGIRLKLYLDRRLRLIRLYRSGPGIGVLPRPTGIWASRLASSLTTTAAAALC
jgi:hypothetical protein